ncbi:hypothetical protein MLD38_019316 [Melastoma candidum]|uniref:Uncharacterized protein n=1 Tax=Melastoma candidum TaxID=119954 RepID=A0ACB9QWM1_9MYRT|nr:hypothetical protein MLD38_019316 [Melastoma candidum]
MAMLVAASDSTITSSSSKTIVVDQKREDALGLLICPSCGNDFDSRGQVGIDGLPAGMKFDPNDLEILVHLEAKLTAVDGQHLHPLIDKFIPMLEGENGICYTHPEKLPGVRKDGQIRHFFHRPSKAYTTGTRKRRKIDADEDGNETRWHKTGKTRPLLDGGTVKGYKKILVLYTNFGRQKKPEKTNWVMHQYHLGSNEEEKDGEIVLSKVFYQTQPRQCGSGMKPGTSPLNANYYNIGDHNPGYTISYNQERPDSNASIVEIMHSPQLRLIPGDGCAFIRFASGTSKGKFASNGHTVEKTRDPEL